MINKLREVWVQYKKSNFVAVKIEPYNYPESRWTAFYIDIDERIEGNGTTEQEAIDNVCYKLNERD